MNRKLSMALKSGMVLSAFLFSSNLKAQDDVGELFKSGPADATKLVNAYMSPLFRGLGVGLNSGWTNTAKTKNTLRFDLRITATAAFVPSSDQTYDVRNLGLQNIRPDNANVTTGPTAMGDDAEGALMRLYANGTPTSETFRLPQGSGIHFVPAPQVQLTVGLPKNIDISLRYMPDTKLGDFGTIGLYGVGAKVEVLPLILGKTEKLIPVDVAVLAAITRLNYNLPLEVGDNPNPNQNIDLKLNGFNLEAIISKKLLFFTPFASVGYNSSNTDLRALGTYEFDTPTPLNPNAKTTFNDPVTIKQTDLSGMKASVGFQMNLAFFRIYASYTAAKYSYANAGIGFGIGK